MGVQLIFAVETNKNCNSDWIYIKDTIEHFYAYERTKVKLSVVYLDGKGNYNSKKKEKEVKKLISQYGAGSKLNQSNVIYCFDCDEYARKPDDLQFLKNAKDFCDSNGYDFVWFCKDIEQVYIGKQVEDSQKKRAAAAFKEKKSIMEVHADRLSADYYQMGTSNLMNILDRYQELARKN